MELWFLFENVEFIVEFIVIYILRELVKRNFYRDFESKMLIGSYFFFLIYFIVK